MLSPSGFRRRDTPMSFQRDRPSARSQIESSVEFRNSRVSPHEHCPRLIGPSGGGIFQWWMCCFASAGAVARFARRRVAVFVAMVLLLRTPAAVDAEPAPVLALRNATHARTAGQCPRTAGKAPSVNHDT